MVVAREVSRLGELYEAELASNMRLSSRSTVVGRPVTGAVGARRAGVAVELGWE